MRYVKYIGLSHERMITAADWRSVGIAGDTVVWSAHNGFAVPLDSFSDSQLDRAIYPDPELIVTAEDEDFTPAPQNRTMTPGQVAQAAEGPVDVLGMVGGTAGDAPAISEASGGRPVVNDAPRSDVITNNPKSSKR